MAAPSVDPGELDAVIVKVAALCNLNCSYCYVYNHADQTYRERPRVMSDDVFDATLERMRAYCEPRPGARMLLIFHGGEPTLVGAKRFDELAARARKRLGRRLSGISIQTNATLIDADWVKVFDRHAVNVGVSIDGPREIHDAARVDHAGRGSYTATVAGLRKLQRGGLSPSAICVINPEHSGVAAYRHLRSLGVMRMNFLLPDVSHDSRMLFYPGRHRTPVADYLIPMFDAWLEEDNPDVEIRIFRGLIRMLMGGEGETDAFGNLLMGYLVVETDGSIEALDALRVCESGINRSGLNILRNGFDDLRAGLPLVYRAVHEGFPLSPICEACHEKAICGGGYLPHRYSRARGFDNPSVWCADILKLLAHIRRRIDEDAAA
jgi:uncharacterized protein